MNILITGANGFIGMALCRKMLSEGYQVRGAVRGAAQMLVLPSGVEGVQVGNIGSETDWSEALAGIEGVVHLAAKVHVMRESASDSLGAFREVNVEGSERLAREAAKARVKRLVYISSIKVNGEGRSDAYTEMDRPAPQDPYAVSKWEAEEILRKVAADVGLEVVILRLPLVYGAGVRANFLRLLRLVRLGIPLPLASIKNRRSMIYLGNLVDAIITSLVHPKAAGNIFLVSDGRDLSIPELIRLMAGAIGRKARLLPFSPSLLKIMGKLTGRSAEIDRLIGSLRLDSSKIRRVLGWEPRFTVEEGIRETVRLCVRQ
ncbi:SDR family oxidoreductase [Thermodesulfovibrionales bacterium]|nr:SDR family oxidoreductase [Thermodesulfovibrionales bacterium]